MVAVKTTFKNLTACMKRQFKQSRCLLTVSIGQEAHEKERFESTIKLINSSFKACTVLLYDSLQRHTMALNSEKPPEAFHQIANEAGSAWIERNQRYLKMLEIPLAITRWDSWLSHPDYPKQLELLRNALVQDKAYGQVFDESIDQYLNRYRRRLIDPSTFDFEQAKADCLEYVLEECSVLCLWPELNCEFEIYPNAHNRAMEATRAKYITPCFPNLLQSISLRFRNIAQLRPQVLTYSKSGPHIIESR